ncbi:glycosyltransferase family 4 protein [Pseudalkalibacillus hwajinpoensis]|uniref:Glycosyltransferase family 1 protein n=1 Tax=Guptibacillus hwajinpoensis TaxID=208199 RepID=A0A4U1MBL8_9BACL|nr:glycosyltransferase family 1 protein [Pseudalkalibacillus hwajinpoensis]TKD68013.1 glycosyltransferase family 1 protein [Pseudalkalibacillus hwajinpoensis]
MKIALFTDTYFPQVNGVSRTLGRLTSYMDRQLIDYMLFAPDCQTEEDLFSNIHRFASKKFFLYPECRIALPKLNMIRKQLREFNPDLLHIATPFNIGLSGLHYGKKHSIPMVASYHTNFDDYLKHYRLELLSPFVWKYLMWFHQPFSSIFVPSSETRDRLSRQGFRNLNLWQRGVDCDLYSPRRKNESIRERYQIKEKYILLFVSRLAPEKNLVTLQNIMWKLPENMKREIRWVVVGDGPAMPHFQHNLPFNVTFTGYKQGHELSELYATADLFIFPSATETFGNVALESLASGTPVIAAKAGGLTDVISDERNGLFCSPYNTEEYIQAISRLLLDQTERKMMGYEGRRYALTQSWDAIFGRLLEDYETTIGHTKIARYA